MYTTSGSIGKIEAFVSSLKFPGQRYAFEGEGSYQLNIQCHTAHEGQIEGGKKKVIDI